MSLAVDVSDADAIALEFSRAASADVRRLSAEALAYLGDAVYELHVRRTLLLPPRHLQHYRGAVVERVRATCQAQVMEMLREHLTEEELAIVRRGRNACGRSPRNVSPELYRQASGLEALLGYLFVSDPQRLREVLALCDGVDCHASETRTP
ncbi:MAG: ribonuclease III domain-containing protein [Cyanobacteria bacterium J06639_1]